MHGNYLKASLRRAGLDPDNLPTSDPSQMSFGTERKRRWKDIWGSGQGIGGVGAVLPAGELVARLRREYHETRAKARRAVADGEPRLGGRRGAQHRRRVAERQYSSS